MHSVLLGFAALLLLAAPARAAFVLTYTQTADGVLASGSGSLDTQGLRRADTSHQSAFTNGAWAAAGAGSSKSADLFSTLISGPAAFGTRNYTDATFSTGDFAGLSMNQKLIAVPTGYQSGAFMSGTSLYAGMTLDSMGLISGDYTYTYGGNEAFTIRITPTAVPEPASLALLGVGLIGAGIVLRRKGI